MHDLSRQDSWLARGSLFLPLTRPVRSSEDGKSKSLKLGEYYKEVAEEYGCHFLDASKIVVASDFDGIHLDVDEHIKLGNKIANFIKNLE